MHSSVGLGGGCPHSVSRSRPVMPARVLVWVTVLASLSFASPCTSPVRAQCQPDPPQWNFAASHPYGIKEGGAAYDPVRKRMLVFGGKKGPTGQVTNDVWQLPMPPASSAWLLLAPHECHLNNMPPPLTKPIVVYDPVNDALVCISQPFQVWNLYVGVSPEQWCRMSTQQNPPVSFVNARGCYDSRRGQVVVVTLGQGVYALPLSQDFPHTWTQVSPAIPNIGEGFDCVYDPIHDRVLIRGGCANGSNGGPCYRTVYGLPLGTSDPVLSTVATDGPLATLYASMVYDPAWNRFLLYGGGTCCGVDDPDEVWELPNTITSTWHQLSPLGSHPQGRRNQSAVYDFDGQRLAMLGGTPGPNDVTPLNDSYFLQTPTHAAVDMVLDLSVVFNYTDAVVQWTEPLDEGPNAAFEIRQSSVPIIEDNWAGATIVGSGCGQGPGVNRTALASGLLDCHDQYIALKTRAKTGIHWSPISNVVFGTTCCTGQPCGIELTTEVPESEREGPPAVPELSSANSQHGLRVIRYGVPASYTGESIELAIFDLMGRHANTLVHGTATPGRFAVSWDARSNDGSRAHPGVYFVRMHLGAEVVRRKMILNP